MMSSIRRSLLLRADTPPGRTEDQQHPAEDHERSLFLISAFWGWNRPDPEKRPKIVCAASTRDRWLPLSLGQSERFEIPHPPPADVEPQPRTYSGDWHPVHESRERTAAWIVGTAPLDEQREPTRYRSYRQDTQTSAGLGGYLRMLADLVDGEDLDGRRDVIQLAQQYLAGAAQALEMKRRQDT
jgi:hypothetical protein